MLKEWDLMSDLLLNPRVIFVTFIWGLFLLLFIRALIHQRVESRQARLIWMIYFISCVAFSFWGEESETVLDVFIGLEHVAVLIKYMALIVVAHLYYLALCDVKPDHSLISMRYVVVISLSAGLLGFILANRSTLLTTEQFRYLFIAKRDVVVSLYMIASFIPAILLMIQAEAIKMMRLKFVFMLLLCFCFLITSIGSLIAFICAVSNWGNPAMPASMVQPFVVLGMVFFILTMVPYRWVLRLVYLRQFYMYYRLRNLEKRIFRKINKDLVRTVEYKVTRIHKNLELQIYRTTISILDHYPLLLKYDTTESLHDELDACKQNIPDYDRLIRKLSRI